MTINELRKAIEARPFKPFTINMSDGRRFHIAHPEFVAVFPKFERTFVIGFPDEQAHELIDLLHVASFTFDERRSGNGRGRRKKAG